MPSTNESKTIPFAPFHTAPGHKLDTDKMAGCLCLFVNFLCVTGVMEKMRRGELLWYFGVAQTNTSATDENRQREEMRWATVQGSVICMGDYDCSPISEEAIRDGRVPVHGLMHPFGAIQRAYVALFEKAGTRILFDYCGEDTSFNQKCGGESMRMKTDEELVQMMADGVWHACFLMTMPSYAIDSMIIRVNPNVAYRRTNEPTDRQEWLRKVKAGLETDEVREIWNDFDQRKAQAHTDVQRKELEGWLMEKKKEMEDKHPRPTNAVSDIDCLRAPLEKMMSEEGRRYVSEMHKEGIVADIAAEMEECTNKLLEELSIDEANRNTRNTRRRY